MKDVGVIVGEGLLEAEGVNVGVRVTESVIIGCKDAVGVSEDVSVIEGVIEAEGDIVYVGVKVGIVNAVCVNEAAID